MQCDKNDYRGGISGRRNYGKKAVNSESMSVKN